MANDSNQITLMIPASSGQASEDDDRGGGETQGLKEWIQKSTSTKTISSDKLKENLQTALSQVDGILQSVGNTLMSQWKVESIAVGLSVNAEGSIGIATAGVETSIEITFCPK